MGAPEELSKAAMFMMGFIMLMPHRIALSCSPYLVKRFHLPMPTVGLFIYKIHSPMELSSLCGTFLANVLTWVNDATIKTTYLKRYCSIIFMWLMFLCSVLTYYLFVSGDEFGYLQYFYWNMIFFTLIYGFMSSFCFGINFNTSLAGAGLPTSGGFTFMLHKVYKWFYKKYHWAEYDYNLMIMQLTTTMGFLLFTSILWTVDQCWNILEPKYEGWAMEGILLVANHKTSELNSKIQKWQNFEQDTDADKEKKFEHLKASDRFNKFVAVAAYLTSEVGKSKPTIKSATKQGKEKNEEVNGLILIITVASFLLVLLSHSVVVSATFLGKNDPDGIYIIPISIDFSILSFLCIFSGILLSNHLDKVALMNNGTALTITPEKNKGSDSNTKNANEASYLNGSQAPNQTDLETAVGKGYSKDEVKTAPEVKELAKANIIAVIGIVSIIVIFACVLLFSIIIFCRDKNSLAAPLFLFTFIATTAALTFGGIAISSAITVFVLYNKLKDTDETKNSQPFKNARICSYVLLPSFGTIAFFGVVLSLTYSYTNCPIIAFILYGAIAGGAAITADDSIKKLFTDGKDWSPIGMLALSMGFVYFFYPSISPYQLVDDEDVANDIELWALLISSIPTLLIALLDIIKEANGPGAEWSDNKRKPWHGTHAAFVPYYICVFFFFSILHFPEGRIGKFFRGHSMRTRLLSVTFNTVEETLEAVGFAGGGHQAGINGPIIQFNVLFAYFVMTVSMFTEDSYMLIYRNSSGSIYKKS